MKSKRTVLLLLAILAAAGGMVYFKAVRDREAEANVGIIERRLDAIKAGACSCTTQPCRDAQRELLEQAGADLGGLRVPSDREAAVRSSVNSKFDTAAACLRRPLPPAARAK